MSLKSFESHIICTLLFWLMTGFVGFSPGLPVIPSYQQDLSLIFYVWKCLCEKPMYFTAYFQTDSHVKTKKYLTHFMI